jgi:hypothetical protein
MPINIRRSQKEALGEGYFEQGGISKTDEGITVSNIENVLIAWAGEFILQAQTNLDKADAVSSSDLSDSMDFVLTFAGTKYRLDIVMLDYYDFVNKGVRGAVRSDKAPNSPYSYKKGTPIGKRKKGSKLVPTPFILSLLKWITNEGQKSRITREAAVTERVYKRKAKVIQPKDDNLSRAYLMRKRIIANGLKPTRFLDDAYAKLYPQLGEDLAKALGEDVSNTFRRLQTKIG